MRDFTYTGKDGKDIGDIWQRPSINKIGVWGDVRMRIHSSNLVTDLEEARQVAEDYLIGMLQLIQVYTEWNLDVGKRIEKQ